MCITCVSSKNYRNKFRVTRSSTVNMIINQVALPSDTMTFSWSFLPHYTAIICLRANHEHKLCLCNFAIHPLRPSFWRR